MDWPHGEFFGIRRRSTRFRRTTDESLAGPLKPRTHVGPQVPLNQGFALRGPG